MPSGRAERRTRAAIARSGIAIGIHHFPEALDFDQEHSRVEQLASRYVPWQYGPFYLEGPCLEDAKRKGLWKTKALSPSCHCCACCDQERAGKTPCIAMMNVRPRNGGMLLWGRFPPAIDVAKGFICTLVCGAEGA